MPRQRRQPRKNREVPVAEDVPSETNTGPAETTEPKNVKEDKSEVKANTERNPGPKARTRRVRNRRPKCQRSSDEESICRFFFESNDNEMQEEEKAREDPKQGARDYFFAKDVLIFTFFSAVHVFIYKWYFHEIYFVKSIIIGILWAHCRVKERSERSGKTYKSNSCGFLTVIHAISILADCVYIEALKNLEEKGRSISTVPAGCLKDKLFFMHLVAFVGTLAGEHEKFLKKYQYVVGAASGLCRLAFAEILIKLISHYAHFTDLVQQHATNNMSINSFVTHLSHL